MARKPKTTKAIVLAVIAIYLAGPVIAVFMGYPDLRGPRIYPEIYHERVFRLVQVFFHGEKPRDVKRDVRPWFYGMAPPVNEEIDHRLTSRKWFPDIQNPPPVVPVLPDGFVAGYASNPLLGEGKRFLMWAPAEVIRKAHSETLLPACFLVSEDLSQEGLNRYQINDDEIMAMLVEGGCSDVELGAGIIDGWVVAWFSYTEEGRTRQGIDFYHPDGLSTVHAFLFVEEKGGPIWANFFAPLRQRMREFTPEERARFTPPPIEGNPDPFAETD